MRTWRRWGRNRKRQRPAAIACMCRKAGSVCWQPAGPSWWEWRFAGDEMSIRGPFGRCSEPAALWQRRPLADFFSLGAPSLCLDAQLQLASRRADSRLSPE